MEYFTLARVLHVLAVILWIGGVAIPVLRLSILVGACHDGGLDHFQPDPLRVRTLGTTQSIWEVCGA
ncbi:MAG: hypothetical protein R2806_25575 [Saprospiraceae bacterium]|nr:hypothetical protein [Lewinella sp.]